MGTAFNSLSRDHPRRSLRLFRVRSRGFQLPLSGSPNRTYRTTNRHFRRQIFQLPLSGSRGGTSATSPPRRLPAFQLPLSGSRITSISGTSWLKFGFGAFNSLSRDHRNKNHQCSSLWTNFQLPLSGSLDVRAVGDLFGTASDATFNSLSRDHVILHVERDGPNGLVLSTPSLGITHKKYSKH